MQNWFLYYFLILGMYKAGIRLRKGVYIIEIVIISLILLNIGLNIFAMRALANLMTNCFQNLNNDLSEAIKTLIETVPAVNMPEINPLQMMVMEMIKKNMNKDDSKPNLDLLRDKEGKFTKEK